MKCTKCFIEVAGCSKRVEGGEVFDFCKFCTILLDKQPTGNVVHDFLHDKVDLTEEETNMLNARIRRARGDDPWLNHRKDGDNKAEGESHRERSKREDSVISEIKSQVHADLMKFSFDGYEMRCSEHYGNIVRKVQEAFPSFS